MVEEFNKAVSMCDKLMDEQHDLTELIFDMSAYLTKLALVTGDAGISDANTMFLNRFRAILGLGKREACKSDDTIVGDF